MTDEQLVVFLRSELERLARKNGDGDERIVFINIPTWMFKRMSEIVIGNVPKMTDESLSL